MRSEIEVSVSITDSAAERRIVGIAMYCIPSNMAILTNEMNEISDGA